MPFRPFILHLSCFAFPPAELFLLLKDDLAANHRHGDARVSNAGGLGGKDVARENGQVRELAGLDSACQFFGKPGS